MTIDIRYVKAVKNDRTDAQVTEKLNKLFHKYDWITRAMVFLKNENEHEGKDYKCEIKLSIPGPQLFAEHQDINFTKAINHAISDLDVQLTKRKELMKRKRTGSEPVF